MLIGLGALLSIVGLVCTIIVLIQAFKDSILKGLICLLCGLYYLYYAIFEFKHENKWLIVILSLLCGGVGGTLIQFGR